MTTAVYCAACALFCLGLSVTGVIPRVLRLVRTLGAAMGELRNPALDDREKERRARAAGIAAFADLGGVVARLAIVCAMAAAPVLAGDLAGLTPAGDVVAFSLDPLVLAATVIGLTGLVWLWRLTRGPRSAE